MSAEKSKVDPISREIQRISNLSREDLVSEVAQTVTNWRVDHGTYLSGDDGISGYLAIESAYRARLMETQGVSASIENEAGDVPLNDDPLIDVLQQALGKFTGKLRMSDAYLICGIEPSKANQDQITRFGRAIRELGWERQPRRFDGSLQYAYVKGTSTEREVELVVEYDAIMQIARILP